MASLYNVTQRVRGGRDVKSGGGRRTDPEPLQTIPCAEGERDAKREREDVVSDDVERRAEVLPALSAQHAAARAGEAVRDLERGDERHHLADEPHDRLVVTEEVPVDLSVGGQALVIPG